jgi:hypothetical protein
MFKGCDASQLKHSLCEGTTLFFTICNSEALFLRRGITKVILRDCNKKQRTARKETESHASSLAVQTSFLFTKKTKRQM